jgi:plasmid stabilization system protein ParE
MKIIFGTVMAMALSFMLACGALGIGFYHLEVARAEEALATFDLALADRIYARLAKTLEIGRRIPWIFETVRADLQIRRSRISYVRKDYAAILEESGTAEDNEKVLSLSLRFIRANARYRAITGEQSREKVIEGLGQSIRDYAKTVEADPTFTDAAFNYEFLLMLRNDIAGGKRPAHLKRKGAQGAQPDQQKSIYGEQGAEPASKVPQRMKVLVPKEGDEDPLKRGPEPGKGSATKKRG